MVRVWSFVVPGDGEHTLEVSKIGRRPQKVSLDGQELPGQLGQVVFTTPAGTVLRLHRGPLVQTMWRRRRWTLLVNEQPVEELSSEGRGLHDLKSLPDGSYTIATSFAAIGIKRHANRLFKLFVNGAPREIVVAHRGRDGWQVAVDNQLVGQERHGLLDTAGQIDFEITATESKSAPLPARLSLYWSLKGFRWCYQLTVCGQDVPVSWVKGRGKVRNAVAPNFSVDGLSADLPVQDTSSDSEDSEDEDQNKGTVDVRSLLQGVSFDREAGVFQATIKDAKTGRFVFLGEFESADAAHQRYLDAVPSYAPGSRLAPAGA